jgi:hypothetical protein
MAQPQVPDNDRRVENDAIASQTEFSFDFGVNAESELTVTKVANADGAVSNPAIVSSDLVARTITIAAQLAGDKIIIEGDRTVERSSNYLDGGEIGPQDLNFDFNNITKDTQEIKRDLGRAALLPNDVLDSIDATLPRPVADAALAWNSTADALETVLLSLLTNPAAVTQPEAEAGTETGLRLWSPLRVAQAIAALGVGEANPDTVSQAEAEAGVATTDRLWTAQRVAQAIAALEVGEANPDTVSQAEAEAGTDRLWTAQRVAQAIAALESITETNTVTMTNKTLTAPKVITGLFDSSGNEWITQFAPASAVNNVQISSAVTTDSVKIAAVGDDTDIGVHLLPKGSGNVNLGTFSVDGDQTVGAGQDGYVLTYDHSTGLISLEAASGGSAWTHTAFANADLQIVQNGSAVAIERIYKASNAEIYTINLPSTPTSWYQARFSLPEDYDGGAINFDTYYTQDTTTSGNVDFNVKGSILKSGVDLSTVTAATDSHVFAAGGTADTVYVETYTVTPTGATSGAGQTLFVQGRRFGNGPNDTLATNIRLLAIKAYQ